MLFRCLFNFFKYTNAIGSISTWRSRTGRSSDDVHIVLWLARVESCQAIQAEEGLTVGEHTEHTIFVKPSINDLVEARRIVEDVPKAVFEAKQGLLEIVGDLVIEMLGDQDLALVGGSCEGSVTSTAGQISHYRIQELL